MAIEIPIFLSAPTSLNVQQNITYDHICRSLSAENLKGRALGRTDFTHDTPLNEVYYIARSCFGGIICGFIQQLCEHVTIKPGTKNERNEELIHHPTPWNHLEAGILFALRKLLLVIREIGVEGGVFDHGTASGFVLEVNCRSPAEGEAEAIREAIRSWSAEVRRNYRA